MREYQVVDLLGPEISFEQHRQRSHDRHGVNSFLCHAYFVFRRQTQKAPLQQGLSRQKRRAPQRIVQFETKHVGQIRFLSVRSVDRSVETIQHQQQHDAMHDIETKIHPKNSPYRLHAMTNECFATRRLIFVHRRTGRKCVVVDNVLFGIGEAHQESPITETYFVRCQERTRQKQRGQQEYVRPLCQFQRYRIVQSNTVVDERNFDDTFEPIAQHVGRYTHL